MQSLLDQNFNMGAMMQTAPAPRGAPPARSKKNSW